jgi:Plavaka transposase
VRSSVQCLRRSDAISIPATQTTWRKRWWKSVRNMFSLWRRYYGEQPPARDPEGAITSEDLDDSKTPRNPQDPEATIPDPCGPCHNISSLLLADFWWNSENEKSKAELSKLLHVLKDPDFSLEDAISTDWGKLESTLRDSGDGDGWFDDAGWITTEISIEVPFHKGMADPGTKRRVVGSLQHRKITAVIEDKIRNSTQPSLFHYQPYEVYWAPGDGSPAARVQGELYNSPAFIDAHQRLQDLPPIRGCDRERVVVALMFWSDETQLSQFGSAKLWPCYMFFGNESKYMRGKTSLKLCEHIAYFESVRSLLLPPRTY